jgi:hypothetical protein
MIFLAIDRLAEDDIEGVHAGTSTNLYASTNDPSSFETKM